MNLESDQVNPGAFRIGGQDDDDGNTITCGEEVRSPGATIDAFRVSARLVEEDPEDYRREPTPEVEIVVAVVDKKRCIYISIFGVSVISVILAIVLGVTLSTTSSQSGATPDLTPVPTPLQRDSMISLIQSRSASTSFSNSSSPQSQAMEWILTDPFSSDELPG